MAAVNIANSNDVTVTPCVNWDIYTSGEVTSFTSLTQHVAMLEVYLIWTKTALHAEIWPFFCQGYLQTVHFDWHIINTQAYVSLRCYIAATGIPPTWRRLLFADRMTSLSPYVVADTLVARSTAGWLWYIAWECEFYEFYDFLKFMNFYEF